MALDSEDDWFLPSTEGDDLSYLPEDRLLALPLRHPTDLSVTNYWSHHPLRSGLTLPPLVVPFTPGPPDPWPLATTHQWTGRRCPCRKRGVRVGPEPG